jgi:hypothetical protein
MWNGFTTFNIVVHHFAAPVESLRYILPTRLFTPGSQSSQNKQLAGDSKFWMKECMQLFAFGPRGAMSICLRSSHEWCSAS